MTEILYVDYIKQQEGHALGYVSNLDTIKENHKKIGTEMDWQTNQLIEHNNIQHVCSAGKYLCSTSLSLDNNAYSMYIVDLGNYIRAANSFAANLTGGLGTLAIKLFHEIQELSFEELVNFELAMKDSNI